jgi:prepilin peptidase CpaA
VESQKFPGSYARLAHSCKRWAADKTARVPLPFLIGKLIRKAQRVPLGNQQRLSVQILDSEIFFVGLAMLCASIGAFRDVRTRRIPNWLTGPSILLGLFLHLLLQGWRGMATAALAGLIGFVVFLIFHVAGGMGAGDVKLMTAVCCLAGPAYIAEILIATALMGGVFAIIVAVAQHRVKETLANIGVLAVHHGSTGLRPHADINVTNPERLRLPYGLAIASGTGIALCTVLLR